MMSDEKTVASMMPKKPAKKAAPKKKAVAKKKVAVKKKPAVKKKAVAKKKRARSDKGQFVADNPNTPENEAWVEEKDLPKVEMPGEFKEMEHPPMGVKDSDRDAAMFLLVVGVIAAIVLAMAFGV